MEVVALGGGCGLSALLEGLKLVPGVRLSAIVSVADDGGSTGSLRKELDLPAMGDLRRVIMALASGPKALRDVMEYRFAPAKGKAGALDGHSLGNLIISALAERCGGFYEGIAALSDVLSVKGAVYPLARYSRIALRARYADGTKAVGETKIPNPAKRIEKIEYVRPSLIKTNPMALAMIAAADYIVLSLGSLYTSVIPNLVAPGVKDAILRNSRAQVVYVANAMTQPGETHGMDLYDHVRAIEAHLEYGAVRTVVAHEGEIPAPILRRYAKTGSYPVAVNERIRSSHVRIVCAPLLNRTDRKHVRHDPQKLARIFGEQVFSDPA